MNDKHYLHEVIANALKDMLGDEEPMTNCCSFPFNSPGYPDNDICSSCGEHAGLLDE